MNFKNFMILADLMSRKYSQRTLADAQTQGHEETKTVLLEIVRRVEEGAIASIIIPASLLPFIPASWDRQKSNAYSAQGIDESAYLVTSPQKLL